MLLRFKKISPMVLRTIFDRMKIFFLRGIDIPYCKCYIKYIQNLKCTREVKKYFAGQKKIYYFSVRNSAIDMLRLFLIYFFHNNVALSLAYI